MRRLWLAALVCLLALVPLGAAAEPAGTGLTQRLTQLAAMPSRVTGYPGAASTAAWLRQCLLEAGVTEIHTQRFPVPVPVDEGFRLETADESLPLAGMWPNLVRTPTLPPAGLEAQLAWGGDGRLAELDGRPIRDRIVVLEYSSGSAWVNLFQLGACAVVFVESPGAHRHEAGLKFLGVPADLPRLYAGGQAALRIRQLAENQVRVRLRGRMSWHTVQGENIIGVVPGGDSLLAQEPVLVTASYDGMAPVPALAGGAADAAGAAALIELARVVAQHPPRRTVIMAFTAGHYENMAGMRHLVAAALAACGRRTATDALAGTDSVLRRRLGDHPLRLAIGLDLSLRGQNLGVFLPGPPYRTPLMTPPLTRRLIELAAAYEDTVLGGRRMLANGLKQDLSRQGLGNLMMTLPMTAAPAALAGVPALGFCTLDDSRADVDIPAATDTVPPRSEHLAPQVGLLSWLIPRLADDPELEPWAWGNDAFGTLRGEVVHYGPRSFLPDQPTSGAMVRVRLRNPTLMGVRPDFWAVADDSGHFVIPGVETRILYTRPVRVEAYRVDPVTGAVTDAPDWGVNGERRLPGKMLTILMDDRDESVQVVTAAVRGLTLIDTFDPRNLLTPESLEMIDAATEAEPPVFGACLPLTPPEMEIFGYVNRVSSWVQPTSVLFAPAATRVKAVMATGLYGLGRRGLLLNATAAQPAGTGYAVNGESRLDETPYRVADDLYHLNSQRLDDLQRHGVRNERLALFHRRTGELLAEAEQARSQWHHRVFLDRARQAWGLAAAAYRDVAETQAGVVQGALFLLAALIPFAHFAERLFFGFADVRRQVVAYFALFAVGFLALSQLHPAFELSISPAVILLGFVILALSLLVTGIGISRLNRELRAMAAGRRQGHDVRRGGVMLTSVAVGLAHLRRRPLRTGLTVVTLVLLSFSVLSFTSIRSSLHANWIAVGQDAAYTGALVRMRAWKPIEMTALRVLQDRFGDDHVAPRAWMSVGSLSGSYRLERIGAPARVGRILGLVGLTPQETSALVTADALVAGRWLRPEALDECLLPAAVADSLGLTLADMEQASISLFGETFRVVGLLRPEALQRSDLNGEPLTPLDPEAQQPAEAAVGSDQGGRLRLFSHLPSAAVAVLPFAALMRWEGASLASVAVRLDPGPAAKADLAGLAEAVDLNLFVGLDGTRYLVNTVGVASVSGLGALAVPLLIAGLIVLNTMMGAVYERTREIGTFNAVGLAPGHVSGLFVAEAMAVAVLGAVAGYLIGQTAAQLMGHWGLLTGLQLNYSSLSSVLTLGLVIGLVVLSTLYPARMAGRICTPGVERRWRPPAPEGHRLEMQLPFTLGRRDALGMAAFLAEFWEGQREQSIGAGAYVEALRVGLEGVTATLQARVWLAPFDQGVVQDATVRLTPGEVPQYYEITVVLEVLAGDLDTWRRVSRTFLDDLRKQFLVWRTLSPEAREAYAGELLSWTTRTAPAGTASVAALGPG